MTSQPSDSTVLVTSSDSKNSNFGTAFIIYQEEKTSYLLSCAHVIKDVGGEDKVKIGNSLAKVIALGSKDGPDDLAVLQAEDLSSKIPLKLTTYGKKDDLAKVVGFQLLDKNYLIRPVQVKLGNQVGYETKERPGRIKAWDLVINDNECLEFGYSGSPVVDKKSGKVLGVVTHRRGEGKKGLAISVEALKKIWPEAPADLFNQEPTHNKNDQKDHHKKSTTPEITTKQRKYVVFFSCEHIPTCNNLIKIVDSSQQISTCYYKNRILSKLPKKYPVERSRKYTSKKIIIEPIVEFVGRHDFKNSIQNACDKMKNQIENCILIINSHKTVNEITYFQIGYALAKGVEILELNDGYSSKEEIPSNIQEMIIRTDDIDDFLAKIDELLISPSKNTNCYISPENVNLSNV